MLASLPSFGVFCAQKNIWGGKKQFLPWREGLHLASLLPLPSSSSQVCRFRSLNYPHSPALAKASFTWGLIPN